MVVPISNKRELLLSAVFTAHGASWRQAVAFSRFPVLCMSACLPAALLPTARALAPLLLCVRGAGLENGLECERDAPSRRGTGVAACIAGLSTR